MKKSPKDIAYVAIQLLLFVAYIFNPAVLKMKIPHFFAGIGWFCFGSGLIIVVIAIIQLNRNLSAFPTPKSGSKLVETGLYKKIRHPIYTGILLIGTGLTLISDSGFRLIVTILLFALFYFKSKFEEKQLAAVFPDYNEYKKRTGRFFAL